MSGFHCALKLIRSYDKKIEPTSFDGVLVSSLLIVKKLSSTNKSSYHKKQKSYTKLLRRNKHYLLVKLLKC